MSERSKGYKTFFESDLGVDLLNSIDKMINELHNNSEKNPDNSRDNSQRARGIRDVQNLIKSLKTGVGGKKKKN